MAIGFACLLLGGLCLVATAADAKVRSPKHRIGCITVQGRQVCASFIPENPQPVCSDDASCGLNDPGADDNPTADPDAPPPGESQPDQGALPPASTTTATAPTATVPQVVTNPAPTAPATVMNPAPKPAPPPPPPPPPPLCLNHPDFPALPSADWNRVDGNCFVKQKADYGMCDGDQYQLVTIDNVDHMLATGYNMGIIVDTPDPQYRLNCLITDVTTYRMNPGDFVFSGKYVQDGWPRDWQTFDNPIPYPWSGWKPLYPLWVQKSQIKLYATATDQSVYSIRAYGLLWGANRYQTVASFTRRLKAQGHTWKGWKRSHPSLAAALISHVSLLRR
jgi:hypothetical protein